MRTRYKQDTNLLKQDINSCKPDKLYKQDCLYEHNINLCKQDINKISICVNKILTCTNKITCERDNFCKQEI